METFGNYLLQMACWLAGFWLVYTVVLKKETFFRLNRWFLFAGMVASLVMPLFPVHYDVVSVPKDLSLLMTEGKVENSDVSGYAQYINPILGLYLLGVLFFVFRFLVQYFKLRSFQNKGECLNLESTPVFKLEKDTAPFSFFNSIFVSNKIGGDTELKAVVLHEKVHIDEMHWVDLLLLEVTRTLQWFNPLLILYRKAVMQNHEFLADEGTLQKGISAHTYKSILANQMLGVPVLKIANGFTLFNPNKRILMMNKDKTIPVKRLKLLWVLPVVAILLVSFAKPNYVSSENQDESQAVSDKTITVKGKVIDEKGKPLPGTSIVVAGTSVGSVSDDNGKFTLEGILPEKEIVFSFVGFETVVKKAAKEIDVTMKKKVYEIGHSSQVAPPPPPPPPVEIIGYGETPPPPPPANGKIKIKDRSGEVRIHDKVQPGKEPLIVVDGEISGVDLNKINPDEIASIEVFKDESAIAVYGDKGKNGVIKITTKKAASQDSSDELFVIVEDMPHFPGGEEAMKNYISEATAGSEVKGSVYVTFTVNKTGKVTDSKVIRSTNDALNKKALEIVNSMPDWKPGMQRGKAVSVSFTVKIDF
jgi:TonB family protein